MIPSLKGWPTKAKEASSPHEVRMSLLDTNPVFQSLGCRGVVVITTAQLHSTKPELRFCAGSDPARSVSEICDGEDL